MESECYAQEVSGAGFSYPYSPYPNPLGFDSRNSPHFHFYDNLSSNSPFNHITFSHFQDTDSNHISQVLQKLEAALMSTDDDEHLILGGSTPHFQSHSHFDSSNSTIYLKNLLVECAQALSDNKLHQFDKLVELARSAMSINEDPFGPLQRLGSYLLDGLVARKESFVTKAYGPLSLNCNSNDLFSYLNTLYEVCPHLKFSYMAANGAIAEACKNEDRIHIIDFQIAQGTQWITLLQALAERPSGAPVVRITGIDDPISRFARGASLKMMEDMFREISSRFNIPVEFHGVSLFASEITKDMLDVRPGEALAVNFPLLLHHTPDESVDVYNPRDGLLRMVKSLSPKVVTLVELESNTNTAAFLPRFVETLDYYSAMFESIDAGIPSVREWIDAEKHFFGGEIVNVIACEGKARVERHELFGKWRSRFMMAGFEQLELSPYVNLVIKGLLKGYSQHYSLVEKDGAMLLAWKNRKLISASAWHSI